MIGMADDEGNVAVAESDQMLGHFFGCRCIVYMNISPQLVSRR